MTSDTERYLRVVRVHMDANIGAYIASDRQLLTPFGNIGTVLGVYDIPVARHVALGLGAMGTVNLVPSAIKAAYGGSPTAVMPFLRLKLR